MAKKKQINIRAGRGAEGTTQPVSCNLAKDKKGQKRPSWIVGFIVAVFAIGLLMAVVGIAQLTGWKGEMGQLSVIGWGPDAAEAIIANKVKALWHGAVMFVGAGVFLMLFLVGRRRSSRFYQILQWALLVLVMADAAWLSRHYIQTMPQSSLAENPVIAILKQGGPEQRVALLDQSGFYNWWLTYLFPYHGIKTVNITQMPRMPADYRSFMETVGRNTLNFWKLSSVGYVLSPVGILGEIKANPQLTNEFQFVYGYNVGPAEAGVSVLPAGISDPPHHVVLRLLKTVPYVAMFAGWQSGTDMQVLGRLMAKDYQMLDKVWIGPESVGGLPELSGSGLIGTTKLTKYRSGHIWVQVDSEKPGLLRLGERYNRFWKATVDGKQVPVRRVDYIFQGVYVPAGTHQVEFFYAPPIGPVWLQIAGLLICFGAIIWLVIMRVSARKGC